jgi:hypothetical protein
MTPGEWIEWAGGECPVDGDALVEIKVRGDNIISPPTEARFWAVGDDWWAHEVSPVFGNARDIIAYRVVQS